MTTATRAMDDLDRLAFRIARTARTHYPHLLAHGFTLADLEERLAPFQQARRELADGGADGYETTLLRLVAGERGYLAADPSLQAACRDALGRPSPTVAFVRAWASAPLTLAGGALALATPGGGTSGAVLSVEAAPRAGAASGGHDPVGSRTGGRGTGGRGTAAVTDVTASDGSCCRYCSGTLPADRHVVFCPHCGLNLTTRQCPACSSELDVAWRFCVTCGRDASLPELLPESLPEPGAASSAEPAGSASAMGTLDTGAGGLTDAFGDGVRNAIGDALAEALDGRTRAPTPTWSSGTGTPAA